MKVFNLVLALTAAALALSCDDESLLEPDLSDDTVLFDFAPAPRLHPGKKRPRDLSVPIDFAVLDMPAQSCYPNGVSCVFGAASCCSLSCDWSMMYCAEPPPDMATACIPLGNECKKVGIGDECCTHRCVPAAGGTVNLCL